MSEFGHFPDDWLPVSDGSPPALVAERSVMLLDDLARIDAADVSKIILEGQQQTATTDSEAAEANYLLEHRPDTHLFTTLRNENHRFAYALRLSHFDHNPPEIPDEPDMRSLVTGYLFKIDQFTHELYQNPTHVAFWGLGRALGNSRQAIADYRARMGANAELLSQDLAYDGLTAMLALTQKGRRDYKNGRNRIDEYTAHIVSLASPDDLPALHMPPSPLLLEADRSQEHGKHPLEDATLLEALHTMIAVPPEVASRYVEITAAAQIINEDRVRCTIGVTAHDGIIQSVDLITQYPGGKGYTQEFLYKDGMRVSSLDLPIMSHTDIIEAAENGDALTIEEFQTIQTAIDSQAD